MASTATEKQDRRANTRDLVIPDVFDPKRRAACEEDDEEWLRVYCADVFYNPFSSHQKRIIADCGEVLKYGTKKSKAAPRGDGKSSIVKYLALKYSLCRQVNFPLIIAATSSKAKKILSSLKRRMAVRSDTPFSQDYPLECHVARYVDPWPSRARNVSGNGQRAIHVEWGADWFILPTWEDEEPLGPIILSLGITSDDLQGCNIYDQRPDFVMLDDLDSRDSLASEDGVVAGKIEETIDKSVAGLGGQGRRLGTFMLCTITSRASAAFKYTDPQQKPAWSGERIPAIVKWPESADLWDEYVSLRISGKQSFDENGQPVDVFGRDAHQFYMDNREAMDVGAVLSNPFNFDADTLPDGSQKQLSALQRCYDYIADEGMNSFLTEHQNDPPEEDGPIESGISATRIQKQLSGFEKGIIPPDCRKLTMGVDVQKSGLYWVVRAWRTDATSFVIDYGFYETQGTTYGSDDGIEFAVERAILGLMEQNTEAYCDPEGLIRKIDLTLVDSGWQSSAVYSACNKVGLGIYPAKGHGKSHGCASPNFNEFQARTKDRKPGDHWFMQRRPNGRGWLVHCHTDHWKTFEHDRWMTQEGKPGCAYIFGEMTAEEAIARERRMPKASKDHFSYAKHLTAEIETEDVTKGNGGPSIVRVWKKKAGRDANHYLDASYLSDVAASIVGIRLLNRTVAERTPPPEAPTESTRERYRPQRTGTRERRISWQ